jgi:putative transposase
MHQREITRPTPAKPVTDQQDSTTTAPAPDLIHRNFTADTPGRHIVCDITYLPVREGWLSLTTMRNHTTE